MKKAVIIDREAFLAWICDKGADNRALRQEYLGSLIVPSDLIIPVFDGKIDIAGIPGVRVSE